MIAGLLALAFATPGSAPRAGEASSLKLSGSIRIRQEWLDGQYRPGFDNRDDMLALRSNLLAEWTLRDWKVVGELSDSRAYDTDAGSVLSANEVNALEPVQAHVSRDFSEPFGKGSTATVQAGRMLLNIGSRRLIASDEFRNTPQGSTGLRADLRFADKTQWTLFYALPQQRRPDDFASLRDNEVHLDHEGFDQRFFGAVWSKPVLRPGTRAELGYIRFEESDGSRATRNRRLHNFDARLIRDAAEDVTDYELEAIFQSGDIRVSTAPAAAEIDVRAYFVHAELGHSWSIAWKPHLSLEFDYASGDGTGAGYGRFDTLFGIRRADLAPSGIYGAVGRANLQALGLRLETTPTSRFDVFGAYRALWAANGHDSFSTTTIRDASGAAGRFAGHQLDARARYWVVPQKWRAEFNTVWLIRGDLLAHAPNASSHGDTHYLTAAITLSY